MITCTNCAHLNPDGATQCEACYTPLPQMITCPSCQTSVSEAAEFCGQCGTPLSNSTAKSIVPPMVVQSLEAVSISEPDQGISLVPATEIGRSVSTPEPGEAQLPSAPAIVVPSSSPKTQLQQTNARLLHIQSDTTFELPSHLPLIHIGKPNDRVPPDIDVASFADSDIVSRIHADVRVEGDAFYLEDVGSSNGTYVNNLPLYPGNRHRLRPGDRIALGKGDKVSFLFQIV